MNVWEIGSVLGVGVCSFVFIYSAMKQTLLAYFWIGRPLSSHRIHTKKMSTAHNRPIEIRKLHIISNTAECTAKM